MIYCQCPHEDCGSIFEHHGDQSGTTCCPECGRQQAIHQVEVRKVSSPMSQEKLLEKNVFVFNEQDNGGESLCLVTYYISNGDPGEDGIYSTQELTLQSYCNSASFQLSGAQITPENLRKLADQLERTRRIAVLKNMPQEPRLESGTPVITVVNNYASGGWTAQAQRERKFGVRGKVVKSLHDPRSHCTYVVKHEDGTTANYDPAELVVDKTA